MAVRVGNQDRTDLEAVLMNLDTSKCLNSICTTSYCGEGRGGGGEGEGRCDVE